MVTRMQLTDFKAFHSLDVQLRPITLLLGPNNSGKSSIIAPLRLLAQTVQAGDRGIPLLLDGPLGDFGTYRDMVHGNYRGRPLRIELEAWGQPPRHRLRGVGGPDIWCRLEAEFKFRTKRRQLILREVVVEDRDGHLITVQHNRDGDVHQITRIGGRPVAPAMRARVSETLLLYNFLPSIFLGRSTASELPDRLRTLLSDTEDRLDEAIFVLRERLTEAEYISAMRLPPERTYHQTGETRSSIGPAGENWTGMLVLDAARPAKASKNLGARVNAWLTEAGLAAAVTFNWLSDRHYEVQVRHPVSGETENLADVGQANSQILPVLVGGFSLEAGSTYMVEEPEIHLHPHAQSKLGDFFAGLLTESGVSSIVETHSEYLVLRMQQLVAAGDLPADAVAFYYVHADTGSNEKCAMALSLNERGTFNEELPGGFFPERLEESRKLARLRAKSPANEPGD